MDVTNAITYRLYRHHTDFSNNVYQKDLSKIGRELSRTIIVDNNAENFQLQPDNGVYIQSWYNDPQDQGLAKLCPLLTDIVKKRYDDVRVALKQFREKASQIYHAGPEIA
jgi:CTD small phosphatase-like protein 2